MIIKRWIRHILFWLIYLIVLTLFDVGPEYSKTFNTFLFLLISLPVYLAYTYLSLYLVMPGCLKSGRFIFLAVYFVVASIFFSSLSQFFSNFVYYQFFNPDYFQSSGFITSSIIANNVIWVNVPFLVFGSAKSIRDYLFELKKKNEIENRNMEAELTLLAAQLHPHFLFNTLNNLYSLSLSGSPQTSVGLQKVIGLMKYILFECGLPDIPVRKEINLIDNYLELEKLRYDKRLKVDFKASIQETDLLIAPMILFTFVENCFKHGSSKATGSSFINILVSSGANNLSFIAENSVSENQTIKKNESRGMGLENVKKRLELLYPGRHILKITSEKTIFKVELTIKDLQIASE